MRSHPEVELNHTEVEEVAERVRRVSASGPAWILKRWAGMLGILAALFLALGVAERALGGATVPWAGQDVLLGVGMAFVVASLVVWFEWRLTPRSREDLEQSIRTQWRQVTAPGWPFHVLAMSGLGALAIGVPVGALLAWGSPMEELPAGSQVLGTLMFVGVTALWVVPAGFLIRYWSVRNLRKYVLTDG